MALSKWKGFRKYRRVSAQRLRTYVRRFVDFGEKVIVDAMKDGGPAFSYVPAGPEELVTRSLSDEEREHSKKSSLDTCYVPPSRSRM